MTKLYAALWRAGVNALLAQNSAMATIFWRSYFASRHSDYGRLLRDPETTRMVTEKVAAGSAGAVASWQIWLHIVLLLLGGRNVPPAKLVSATTAGLAPGYARARRNARRLQRKALKSG